MKTIKLHLTFVLLLIAVQGFSHQLISVKENKQPFYADETNYNSEISKAQTPIIEDTNICTTVGSLCSISVLSPEPTSTYVWQIKTPSTDWTTITSANAGTVYSTYQSTTLNIKKSSTLPVSGTLYRVIVNDGISGDLTSNEATLTVTPLAVAKSITGASPTCIGESKVLSYGIGYIGTIQWQYSTTSDTEDFYDVDGETGLNYTATNLQETTWFRVMNTSGECGSTYSPAVKVTVSPQPWAGYIDGGEVNVCAKSNSTELILYDYEGDIKWQRASDVGGSPGTFTTILNATSEIYTVNSLTNTTYFRALVSNGVCPPVTTEIVAIYVDPTPVSKLISGASTVCFGEDKILTYGTGSTGTIQWQYSTTSDTEDFYDVDGETGLNYTATNLQETTWFRVMNSSGECDPTYSPAVKVTVSPESIAGYIDGGEVNVCKKSNSTELILYDYEGNIKWQKALDVGGSPGTFTTILNATSEIYTTNSLTDTTYFRALVSSGVCPPATTEIVAIYVDPTPVSKPITGASPICAGENITLTYGTGSVGTTQWQYSTTSGTEDFYDVDGETELSYTATELQETTWFRVMNSSGECDPTYSSAVKVTVSPESITGYIDGGEVNVCAKSNSTELILYDYEGNIKWQRASDVGGSPGTFTTIPNATSEIYTANSLTNTTYFRALVSNGVCPSATTEIVAIYVDPKPISKTITGASPACIGGSKVLTYGANSVGTIQWQSSATSNAEDFYDIDGEMGLSFIASDLQETTWYRIMNTSGECDAVYSPAVEVLINPQPVSGFIDGGDVTVSENSNKTVLTLNDYTGTIKWQKAASLTGPYDDIPSADSSSYIAEGLTTTTYFRAVVSGECSTATSKSTIINVDSEFNVMTFPNPFDSEFNIKITTLNNEQIELKVYDMLGRTIEQRYIQQTDIVEIGSNYPSGFYNIIVRQGEKEKMLRVIKR
ncbi:MAG: T9SS type A sorting domain-containing protein [Flavobacterium sp.]